MAIINPVGNLAKFNYLLLFTDKEFSEQAFFGECMDSHPIRFEEDGIVSFFDSTGSYIEGINEVRIRRNHFNTVEFFKYEVGKSKGLLYTRIQTDLDTAKRIELAKLCIANLEIFRGGIESLELTETESIEIRIQVVSLLEEYIDNIKKHYLFDDKSLQSIPPPSLTQPTIPKIQWLGNTNLLGTLFYDLLNGQEKLVGRERNTTKPLIKSTKEEIISVLQNCFVDKNNKTIPQTTLSDYLNSSKPQKRAKSNKRIELPD